MNTGIKSTNPEYTEECQNTTLDANYDKTINLVEAKVKALNY